MPQKHMCTAEFANKPCFFLQAPALNVSETWRHLRLLKTKFDQTHHITHFEHTEFDYQGGFSDKIISFCIGEPQR